jgi:CheY-like chemotaxis protein
MSLSIIIIDDDPVSVFLHKVVVIKGELSADPQTFFGGQEALDYLDARDRRPSVYLLLLDINMPVMSGWDFLDAIRSRSYADQVYAVIVSSSIDTGDHKKAEQYKQVIGYLEKPINVRMLQDFKSSDVFQRLVKTSR